jgi:flagellar motility protein MotE (MotC chaperone)
MQQELARREQDVLMLKQQMEARLQELQSTEKKVQGMLKEAHGVHDQKIKHLISAYTNMKPKQAALALESLDERLAVRILAGMNPKQAGEMLTYTNPKTVAKLTELLARMQLPGQ